MFVRGDETGNVNFWQQRDKLIELAPNESLKARSVLTLLQGTFGHRLIKYIFPDLQKFRVIDAVELSVCNIVNIGSIVRRGEGDATEMGYVNLKNFLSAFLPRKYADDQSDIMLTLTRGELQGDLARSSGKCQKTFYVYSSSIFVWQRTISAYHAY